MQRFLRLLLPLAVLLAATGLVACGGDDENAVGTSTDVDTLLDKTFTGSKKIDSGKLDLKVKIDVQGGGSELQGPIDIALSGPFASEGEAKLPKLDLDLKFSGAGQNITAGVVSTGDKGFVSFNGTDYVLSDQVFQQFKQGYEQAAKQGASKEDETSLQALGINPKNWLTDPKNAGEGKVGDTDVIKITGGVDVGKLLDDLNKALAKAGSLGLAGQAEIPTKLTEEQKQEVAKAVKDVDVEIATGKDDSIMRRMAVGLQLADPGGSGGQATVSFELSFLDLNEEQEFDEPEGAKPFDQLLQQFGGLGGLGALGGLGGGSGSGSGSGGSGGSGSGGSDDAAAKLQEYTKCLEEAGQDVAKAQDCAELLNP